MILVNSKGLTPALTPALLLPLLANLVKSGYAILGV